MLVVQVKAVSSRVECGARVVVLVGVLVGLILVLVWETVFTPAVHLTDDSNSTVSQHHYITDYFQQLSCLLALWLPLKIVGLKIFMFFH